MHPFLLVTLAVLSGAITCPAGYSSVAGDVGAGYCGKTLSCSPIGYTYSECAAACAASTPGGQVYAPPLQAGNAWSPSYLGQAFGCGSGKQQSCGNLTGDDLVGLDCWLGAARSSNILTTVNGQTCNLGTPANCDNTSETGYGSNCPFNSWRACSQSDFNPSICGIPTYNSISASGNNTQLYVRNQDTCNQNSFRPQDSLEEVCLCGVNVYSGVAIGKTCADCIPGTNGATLGCQTCAKGSVRQNSFIAVADCGCGSSTDLAGCCSACYNNIACGNAPFNGTSQSTRDEMLQTFKCDAAYTKSTDCSSSKKGLLGLLGLLGLIPLLLCLLLLSCLCLLCLRRKKKGEPQVFATFDAAAPQVPCAPLQQACFEPSAVPCFGGDQVFAPSVYAGPHVV